MIDALDMCGTAWDYLVTPTQANQAHKMNLAKMHYVHKSMLTGCYEVRNLKTDELLGECTNEADAIEMRNAFGSPWVA